MLDLRGLVDTDAPLGERALAELAARFGAPTFVPEARVEQVWRSTRNEDRRHSYDTKIA